MAVPHRQHPEVQEDFYLRKGGCYKLLTCEGRRIKHKNGGVAEKNLLTELEDAEAQDALAASIISTNVSRECLEHIKTLDTAFEIMQKLKTLYQGSESSDIQHWMKKLYSLKAKSLTACKCKSL
ncbi:hypothetical protein BCR36DRAFT_121409 [Piromyces finnis]|uniref:Uncharacterized protein n=1 Tax=Piromyces finnis TaxID=1754191 RepID=A0A1Y1V168_9FUNG|nr:hypothetical protein BCR36DRAFT_121409 [Piromyces finnis]|eukprot:ORX44816.1 hypothetical protein BCR36DRAFT_121409 [Piromyces finnis]